MPFQNNEHDRLSFQKHTKKTSISSSITKEFIFLLFFFLGLRIFLFEPFYVPTGSMIPNIMAGDFLIATKYNYGYSKYSIPFFPNLFSDRVMDFYAPKRGDIIVFYSHTHKERLIKRVIGVPGDTVQMINNVPYVNHKPLARKYLEDVVELNPETKTEITYKKYLEILPNGEKYTARYVSTDAKGQEGFSFPFANTEQFLVEPGYYFVMGDNRDESSDGRTGLKVKHEEIIGKAGFVLFSNEHKFREETISLSSISKFFTSFRAWRFIKKIHNQSDDLEFNSNDEASLNSSSQKQ